MPEITRIGQLIGALTRVEAEISRFASTYDAQISSTITQANEWPESFDDKFKMIRSISQSIKINYGKLISSQKMALKLREELSKLTPPIPEEKLEAFNEKIKKLLGAVDN